MSQQTLVLAEPSVEARFEELAGAWKEGVVPLWECYPIIHSPAYQEVIRLGMPVVPLLLRDLALGSSHWFDAPEAIAGIDPVTPDHRGEVRHIVDDWLAWGRERGLTTETTRRLVPPNLPPEEAFELLKRRLDQETGFSSNPEKRTSHPAYRAVIALGWTVVPLILRDMERHHSDWFFALEEITNEKPYPREHRGGWSVAVGYWVEWGKGRGLI